MKKLSGIHHVTAITSSAERIYELFTDVLGMRLVKKTINQDDIDTYHLFFADDVGSAGTDMTFFDFKGIQKAQKGTDEIARTFFRVPSDKAIAYWEKRFSTYNIAYEPSFSFFGRKTLYFQDFDNQEYALVSDEKDTGIKSGIPWKKGPVPDAYAITGLGPILLRISEPHRMHKVLCENLGMKHIATQDSFSLYEMGKGGNGGRVIVETTKTNTLSLQGYGSVHHVAFRIEDKAELDAWTEYLNSIHAPNSGFVDRFYFKSLYTRLYPAILFEFATEGPGFIDDEEDYETLGETLALPPAYRDKREQIERVVRHIDTKRSDKTYKKEYLGFE